jgi:hypothetical protein
MVKIEKFEFVGDWKIRFYFSDGSKNLVDFSSFIGDDALSSRLRDLSFFHQVKLYEGGRGIFWPNDFDFCPDFLISYKSQGETISHP